MGFLRRLLGRPGEDENGDAGLLAPRVEPRATVTAPDVTAKPEPVIISSPMPEPAPVPVAVPTPTFTSHTYATEPVAPVSANPDRVQPDDPTDHTAPPASAWSESVGPAPEAVGAPEPVSIAEHASDAEVDPPAEMDAPGGDAALPDGSPDLDGAQAVATGVPCPSCAVILDPPPERTRRCPYCREQIVVRRVDGRAVYLTEAALPVFEQERQRIVDTETWTEQRQRWLRLAGNVRAPAARRTRLAGAPLTAAVVQASRTLYLSGADLAVRAARNEKRWQDVARIRREQSAALWAEAGGKVPPPPEVTDLHEEAMLAELRSMTRSSREAELISARCCKTCRADDGKAFRINAELKVPRLPHTGCPKGICKCEWWPTMSDPNPKARRRATTPEWSSRNTARQN